MGYETLRPANEPELWKFDCKTSKSKIEGVMVNICLEEAISKLSNLPPLAVRKQTCRPREIPNRSKIQTSSEPALPIGKCARLYTPSFCIIFVREEIECSDLYQPSRLISSSGSSHRAWEGIQAALSVANGIALRFLAGCRRYLSDKMSTSKCLSRSTGPS